MSFANSQITVDMESQDALVAALKAEGEATLARKIATWPSEFGQTERRIVILHSECGLVMRAFTNSMVDRKDWPVGSRFRMQSHADALEIAQEGGLV